MVKISLRIALFVISHGKNSSTQGLCLRCKKYASILSQTEVEGFVAFVAPLYVNLGNNGMFYALEQF